MLRFVPALLAVVYCLVVVFAFGQTLPPKPKPVLGWEGTLAPPYLQNPQMVLAADCATETECFLAGGSNGVGFGVYKYNGGLPAVVTGPMNEPNMSMMVMDIAAEKTATGISGVFCGIVDFTVGKGLQYLSGNTWLPSAMPLEIVWASQSVSASKDGMTYVAVGNGFTSDLMISNDGGLSFRNQNINYAMPNNCTSPGYIAIPNKNAWFMTIGASPSKSSGSGSGSTSGSSGSGSSFHSSNGNEVNAKYFDAKTEAIIGMKYNNRVLIIKNKLTGAVRVHTKTAFEHRQDELEALAADSQCNYYYGAILKSTNQGQTWTKVFEMPNAALSYLSCFDEQSCAATAFNAGESYSVVSTDGNTFKVTYTTVPATSTEVVSIGNIAYASKTDLWIGGSQETQSSGAGMFWNSKDGGLTWTQYPHYIPDVMVIMAIDFVSENVGYAVGMTMFKTTQIMRYKDQSNYGSFVQSQCPVAGCSFLCQNVTFPQGMCLETSSGSAKAFCSPDGAKITQYIYETTSCVGGFQTVSQPTNVCINGTNTFFENYCGGSSSSSRVATKKDILRH